MHPKLTYVRINGISRAQHSQTGKMEIQIEITIAKIKIISLHKSNCPIFLGNGFLAWPHFVCRVYSVSRRPERRR